MPPTFDTSPPAETPCRGATSGVAGPTLRAAPSHGRYAERSEPRMRERADRDSNTRTITDGTDGTPEAGRPSDRCSGPLTWAFLWHPQRDSNPCRHLERAQTDPHGGPWSPLRPRHGTARPHTDPLNAPSFVELVARWMARRVGCWTAGERTPKGRRGAPGRVTDRHLGVMPHVDMAARSGTRGLVASRPEPSIWRSRVSSPWWVIVRTQPPSAPGSEIDGVQPVLLGGGSAERLRGFRTEPPTRAPSAVRQGCGRPRPRASRLPRPGAPSPLWLPRAHRPPAGPLA